jgi:REP element-mobilizing transposase RayT
MVRANLYHHSGRLYHLLAYCIMPNHVRALLQPTSDLGGAIATRGPRVGAGTRGSRVQRGTGEPPVPTQEDERADAESPLASIMHSLKSYTAHEANKLLSRSGHFWQPESYDHWVRGDEELARIVDYICWNPVKAGLAQEPHEWVWGSAHDRFVADGTKAGWIAGADAP